MKPIKFNLILDGKIIRSLDELMDNFNIDDIYDLFKKRILQKWLKLQNENTIVERLDSIDDEDAKVVLEKILSTFGYDSTKMDLEIFSHLYGRAHQKEVATSIADKKSYSEIIDKYHMNYLSLKEVLRDLKIAPESSVVTSEPMKNPLIEWNPNKKVESSGSLSALRLALGSIEKKHFKTTTEEEEEEKVEKVEDTLSRPINASSKFGEIKAIINEISDNYLELFHLDLPQFFAEFMKENPIVVMTCIMNNRIREILLADSIVQSHLENAYNDKDTINRLKPYLKSYTGNTDGMWKYLGDAEKRYLVVNVSVGAARVGEQMNLKNDFGYRAINGKYLILEGLMFKSSTNNQTILYLEV